MAAPQVHSEVSWVRRSTRKRHCVDDPKERLLDTPKVKNEPAELSSIGRNGKRTRSSTPLTPEKQDLPAVNIKITSRQNPSSRPRCKSRLTTPPTKTNELATVQPLVSARRRIDFHKLQDTKSPMQTRSSIATSNAKNQPPQRNKKIKIETEAVEETQQVSTHVGTQAKKKKTKTAKTKPVVIENDPPVVKFVGLGQPQQEGHDTLHNVQVSSCGKWCDLGLDKQELHLARTLLCGMTFRWARMVGDIHQYNKTYYKETLDDNANHPIFKQTQLRVCDDGMFVGALDIPDAKMSTTVGVVLLQLESTTVFRQLKVRKGMHQPTYRSVKQELRNFLSAEIHRGTMDVGFAAADAAFRDRIPIFPGLRIVKLPLLECIISFVGSANNNIKRNTKMIASLCMCFEENLCVAGVKHIPAVPAGEMTEDLLQTAALYRFPSLRQLASLSEQRYTELGWGYRAPRMENICEQLLTHGDAFMNNMAQTHSYVEARDMLVSLCGIGRKVADCICLFGLSFFGVIPVDTHCWQFAQRYKYIRSVTNLNKTAHNVIADRLRDIFGPNAGWAFMVLFIAEVHPFRTLCAHLPQTYVGKKRNPIKQETIEVVQSTIAKKE